MLGAADNHRILQKDLKDELKIERRSADGLESLCSGSLLSKGFA